jgi:hypothetical protein
LILSIDNLSELNYFIFWRRYFMAYGNGVNAARGLQPRMYLNGAQWSGQSRAYPIQSSYATAIYYGSPVTTTGGYLAIGAAGTNPLVGVFIGVNYFDASNNPQYSKYWPAATATFQTANAQALVVDDPMVLFDVQVDDSTGPHTHPFVDQTSIGLNGTFVLAAGTQATSFISQAYLDYTTVAVGATLNLKLIDFTPVPGNGPSAGGTPTTWYNNVLVLINNHKYKGGTGTFGS